MASKANVVDLCQLYLYTYLVHIVVINQVWAGEGRCATSSRNAHLATSLPVSQSLNQSCTKTVNPLDPCRGNFDSMRGWVCFRLTEVERPSRSAIWLVDSGPSSVIGWFEGAKTQQNLKLAVKLHSLCQYWQDRCTWSQFLLLVTIVTITCNCSKLYSKNHCLSQLGTIVTTFWNCHNFYLSHKYMKCIGNWKSIPR